MSPMSVQNAIWVHRALNLLNESHFDNEGNPTGDKAVMEALDTSVHLAWLRVVNAPCETLEDVRVKVEYILHDADDPHGPTLLDELTSTDNGPGTDLPAFLQSLTGAI